MILGVLLIYSFSKFIFIIKYLIKFYLIKNIIFMIWIKIKTFIFYNKTKFTNKIVNILLYLIYKLKLFIFIKNLWAFIK